MKPARLTVRNLGPIREAAVDFGDLTVLTGPQASGKTILLATLKFILDAGPMKAALSRAGLTWQTPSELAELIYGEGLAGIWANNTEVTWRGKAVSPGSLGAKKSSHAEKCFYIPAQRVLAFSRDGWFKPFSEFRAGDPFVVRDFSDKIRVLMESGQQGGAALFPRTNRLKREIRDAVQKTIFGDYSLEIAQSGPQKRLVMRHGQDEVQLPFMVWSTGQREFTPLLLGLYYLLPPGKVSRRDDIEFVVIEEPEMGLHPRAIEALLFVVLELMLRGYRVCLSTHSIEVLNMVWAFRHIQRNGDANLLLRLFGVKATPATRGIARAALRKDFRCFYFDRKGPVEDLGDLSIGSALNSSEWGGLTEFSSRAADVVSEAVSR